MKMLVKKEDIKSGSEARRRQSLPAEACPYCGRQKEYDRISLGELATSILCVILLMAIAVPLVCIAEHWLEHQGQKSFDNLIWRERIENW
jgi:hypothetical protein